MITQNTHHSTKYTLGITRVLVVLSLCLLFVLSALYGNEMVYGSNVIENEDTPKSYDYLLNSNGGLSVNDALSQIQTRFNNNEQNSFTILLANGTYSMPIFMLFYDESSMFSDLFIEIRGLGTTVQIPGDNFIMTDFGNLHLKLNNISITGGSRGIEAHTDIAANGITFLELKNCRIYGNISTNWGSQTCMDGTGIYANGPTIISGCDIYNNIGYNWVSPGLDNYSRGGGIAVINNTSHTTEISDCNIYGNEANAGGGIFVSGSAPIEIVRNRIYENTRKFYVSGGMVNEGGFGEGVYAYDCDNLNFSDNVVTGQIAGSADYRVPMPISSAVVVESCGYSQSVTSVVIENNSFMDNDECHGLWLMMPAGGTLVRNNLSCGNKFGIYLSDFDDGYITLKHNNAHGNGLLNNEVQNYYITYPSLIVSSNNYELDPQVNSSYAPLWNSSVISWLIDGGDPDLIDADETPSDIGAIRVGEHQYDIYDMPTGLVSNGIKWMSFPIINSITSGYNVSQNFFGPIVDQDILEWVQWKELGDQIKYMTFVQGILENGNHEVTSIQGYKLRVQEDVLDQYTLAVTGYRQAPHTVISLVGGGEENWIGYFCKESSSVLDAFSPILSNIISIETQYWSATQVFPGVWLGNIGDRVLNHGDMVIVKCTQNTSFSWNNNQPVDPKSKKLPKEFSYTEKPAYTPVYISVDQSNNPDLPSEIGLYVNGVCKGAAVVDSPEIDICAYLDANETITEENSQLVFYYPAKSAADQRSIYPIRGKSLKHNTKGTEYYAIDIYDLESAVPVSSTSLLSQNYPNPFNPTTTISFEIPNDAHVSLEIYNVRGQMVKRLLNTPKAIGKHSVTWDGKDEQGRDCSSGIYYYRLKSHGIIHTQKMLMLK